jgi:thymidylate synthase (FAD)
VNTASLVWATSDADALVARIARVSNPANQDNAATAGRLIGYLIKHQHWSPFEMVSVCMEVVTTRDIARQIIRHRSFSFQEFSQRYAEVGDDPPPLREARMQDTKNRQNSVPCDDDIIRREWRRRQKNLAAAARDNYRWAINSGIAKEQARVLLPEGLTPSRLYMAGTLRSWLHYCDLRRGNGTQLEHTQVADAAWEVIKTAAPLCAAAYEGGRT